MSSLTAIANTAASVVPAGLSTALQLKRAYEGDKQRVKFLRGGQTLMEFDAVLQETHGIETQPTAFPVEDGNTIGDHIIVAPLELNISGIVTDTPLNNRKQLFRSGITQVANNIAGPLGVLGATAAFAAAGAQHGTSSPSIAAYNALVTLATGNVKSGVGPAVFDVFTRVRTYPNMCIKSISSPRDSTTGSSMLFTVQLQQMLVVSSQSVRLDLSKQPELTSIKQRLESETDDDSVVERYKKGVNRADIATGQAQRFAGAGT